MEYKLFQHTCLRIYQIGLSRLMNSDWILSEFPNYLNFLIERKKTPNDLFFSTIQDGILNNLGSLFFNQILSISDNVLTCDAKTAFERSYEVLSLLIKSGCDDRSEAITELLLAIDAVYVILVETPDKRVNSVFHRQQIHFDLQDKLEKVYEHYQKDIDELRKLYAKNFAERVFHDRQICEYISFALTQMYEEKGFPTLNENGQIVIKPVERKTWPSWVRETLRAREDECANCSISFKRLKKPIEIDHIVPLSHGGSNDIVNLQLLCWDCNHEKLDEKQFVNSSFPEYFKVWSKKGYKYPNTAKKSS